MELFFCYGTMYEVKSGGLAILLQVKWSTHKEGCWGPNRDREIIIVARTWRQGKPTTSSELQWYPFLQRV